MSRDALDRLKWCLQALAAPAEDQLRLYPDFVCKADELGDDFYNWCLYLRSKVELSEEQRASLDTLEDVIKLMSRRGNDSLWSGRALGKSARWTEVRLLARQSLELFGWPAEVPYSEWRAEAEAVEDQRLAPGKRGNI